MAEDSLRASVDRIVPRLRRISQGLTESAERSLASRTERRTSGAHKQRGVAYNKRDGFNEELEEKEWAHQTVLVAELRAYAADLEVAAMKYGASGDVSLAEASYCEALKLLDMAVFRSHVLAAKMHAFIVGNFAIFCAEALHDRDRALALAAKE